MTEFLKQNKKQFLMEGSSPLISFKNVSLCFRKHSSLFNMFFKGKNKDRNFWALKEISFSVYDGDTLGVIGRNGSGKSTLSLLGTKVYHPDSGKVNVNGKVHLLSLGVGFQNHFTGRENVYISGSLLGLTKSEISQKMDEIERFADIGDFIDEQVKIYSSGMKSRLGFAIDTAIHSDILILDEVMATGDSAFQNKAVQRIQNLHALAKCALIISHNPNQLRKLCNKVLWLEKGRLVMIGNTAIVLDAYKEFCKDPKKWIYNNAAVRLKKK